MEQTRTPTETSRKPPRFEKWRSSRLGCPFLLFHARPPRSREREPGYYVSFSLPTKDLLDLSVLARHVAGTETVAIEAIAHRYVKALQAGGVLYFAGNGGSAADAQHIAAEYMVRFMGDRDPYRAIALTTDTSFITACG